MFELEISVPATDGGAEQQSELQRIDATFDSFQEFVAETAAYLSPKSILLATRETLPAGTAVRLEVALAGGTSLIRALGQITSPQEAAEVDAAETDGARPPGLDIRFTYLDPASARVIDSVSRLGQPQELPAEQDGEPEVDGAAGVAAAGVAAAGIAAAGIAAELPPTTPEVLAVPEPVEDPAPSEPPAADEIPPSLAEEEEVSEPEEESWELEVDSLLSEVLPEDATAVPAPAPSPPPSSAAPAADDWGVVPAEAGIPEEPAEAAGFDLPEPPATFAEELSAPPLQDLPLRAPDDGAIAAEAAPEEVLPAIDLEPAADAASGEVQLDGAGDEDSLVLGFGESITMAPPQRRSAFRPLALLVVGLAALGLFFYLRGDRFGFPGSGESGAGSEPPPVVAQQQPGVRPPGVRPTGAQVPASEGAGAPASGGSATGAPGAGGPPPAAGTETPPAVAAPPPAAVEPPPPAVAETPPPTVAETPPAATPPPPAITETRPPPAAAPPTAAPGAAASPADVEAAVKAWAAAWSAQDVDAYVASYAPDYSPPGLSHQAWKEQRRVRVRAPKEIQVNVSNFSIELLGASRARARFLQHYATDTRNLRTWKTVELQRLAEDGWKIAGEANR